MAMESEMNRQKGFFCELINEKLQYGPSRAVNCFVVVVVVVVVSPRPTMGTLRVEGKQNSLFPKGPVMKCFEIEQTEKKIFA